eukprot:SAG11_NODE_1015_length_6172_cov_13.477359_3_plen_137_part_00
MSLVPGGRGWGYDQTAAELAEPDSTAREELALSLQVAEQRVYRAEYEELKRQEDAAEMALQEAAAHRGILSCLRVRGPLARVSKLQYELRTLEAKISVSSRAGAGAAGSVLLVGSRFTRSLIVRDSSILINARYSY